MPTYDYSCADCGHREEVFQKMTDDPLTQCPACLKQSFQRGFGGGIGLHFKGSGFYITDYPKGEKGSSTAESPKKEKASVAKD